MKPSEGKYFNSLSYFLSRFAFVWTHVDFVVWLLFLTNDPLKLGNNYLPFRLPTLDSPLEEVKSAETCQPLILPNLLSNLLVFAVWCGTHSGFARESYKRAVGLIDHPLERPIFAAIASILWFLQIATWKPITNCVRWDVTSTPILWWCVSLTVMVFGFVLIAGLLWTLPDHVFGTDRYKYPPGKFPDHGVIKVTFPYGLVRHPTAAGFLWFYWSVPSYTPNHLFLAGLWTVFIFFGTLFEERGISDETTAFGREYVKYRKQVDRFFPNWNSLMIILGKRKYKED